MLPSASSLLAGFLLRAFQVGLESSLYLLIGFLAAGTMRALIGPDRLRRFFGSGRVSAPLRAWAAASTMMPACALGVLPVACELRRSGVARHAVLTFVMAAPMLNPITLLYGLSYLGPQVMLVVVVGTFCVSVGAGICVGGGRDLGKSPEEPSPAAGGRRLLAGGVHAARSASGSAWRDVALGLVAASITAAMLPETYLAEHMFARDRLAVARMAAVAPSSYVTPEGAMTMIPEVLKFDQSAGAMFLVLSLGAGMTLGHVGFLGRNYGRKAAAVWLVAAMAIATSGAGVVQAVAPRVGTANQDNDHFGELGNPFPPSGGFAGFAFELDNAIRLAGPLRWGTAGALLALVLTGWIARALGGRATFEAIAGADVPGRDGPHAYDRPLPKWAAAALIVGSAAGMATVGAFAYYPSPSEVFRDMAVIKADLFSELKSASPAVPLHHLDLWQRQVAKLPMGAVLRLRVPSVEANRLTVDLRDGIAGMRRAVEAGREPEARALFMKLLDVYEGCGRAYEAK